MRYEIDPTTFAISIYEEGKDVPFWYQPDYPNTDKFDSYEEAEQWALSAIQSYDVDFEFYPKDGKNLEPRKKPTKQEILESKVRQLGLSIDDLKEALGLIEQSL